MKYVFDMNMTDCWEIIQTEYEIDKKCEQKYIPVFNVSFLLIITLTNITLFTILF